MRPNQQNMNKQRSRGRNNNNQRRGGGGNPLSRNYESNGPDVKVRGNAAHIAEKYTQLARDAAASGDNVMAENYLQHAEHYNRIILAAQAQIQPRPDQQADTGNDEDGADEPVTSDARFESRSESRSEQPAEATGQSGEPEGEDSKPRRQPRARRPRREKTEESAEAAPQADADTAKPVAANGEGEADEKPKRARRAPRRTTKPADADGPGELPAFLTAGREAAAE